MDGPARMPQFYALSGFIEASSHLAAADPLEVLTRMCEFAKPEDREAHALFVAGFIPVK